MAKDGAAPASASTPNATSLSTIRAMIDSEPVLAKKWASKDGNNAVNMADTIQLDDDGNINFLNLGGIRLKSLPNVWSTLDRLTTLNLGGTDLPLDQMKAVLSSLVNVEELCLGGNALGKDGAAMVAELVETSTTLKHLDMRFNDIGDDGMIVLSIALAKNSCIQFLYLEGNLINSIGCSALAKALLENASIQELYLGANNIGPDGAASLAEVLLSNKTLNKLYLDGNQLGAEGAAALAGALEQLDGKATLKKLYVDNNNLGKPAAQRLAKALNSDTAMGDSLLV